MGPGSPSNPSGADRPECQHAVQRSAWFNRTRERSGRTIPNQKSVRHFPQMKITKDAACLPTAGSLPGARSEAARAVCYGSDSWPDPHLPGHPTPAADAPNRQPCQRTARGGRRAPGAQSPGHRPLGAAPAGTRREGSARGPARAEPSRAEQGGRARRARRLRHRRKWRQPGGR